MNRPIPLLILAFILFGCAPATQTTLQTTPEPDSVSGIESSPEAESTTWWREAVFYEIFVRSFYDSNGDGIGDFNGITQKLDYIQSLGVRGIWLMPIHPSPSYHGYDVLNYYAVSTQYGSMDDFKNFLNEAHKRNIKIIIDLVLNHSSSRHPFFMDADGKTNSIYRDWYVWSGKPGNHWHLGRNGYYYGFFGNHMPDLNYRNPDVTRQMENVTRYWLEDIGVDGFRLDAIKYLVEEDEKIENTESTHEWLREYYTFYKSTNPDAYTVGEVSGAGAFLTTKYRGQMDHIFNFELANGFITSAQTGSNTYAVSALKLALKDNPNFDFGSFLTNHDQNRTMSILDGDTQKAKLSAFLMLTTPGTPFIYYGEEIGMKGQKPDPDIRLPMQWNADANAGFTSGKPWRAVHEDYAQTNVAAQGDDPNSLLNHYRALIHIRQSHSALRTGKVFLIETGNPGVYAILCLDKDEILLVLANLKDQSLSEYALTLTGTSLSDSTYEPATLFGNEQVQPLAVTQGGFKNYKPVSALQPYSTLIVQFQP